ncbi:RICIN domain-containing protein, partial [Micromonospora chersina]|uniref:RICIN domain-containing protein n=1 Tax=Micromonospora chersina TaxID=47854 RepID=UPI0037ACEFF7
GSLVLYAGHGGNAPLSGPDRTTIGTGLQGYTPFGLADWNFDRNTDLISRRDATGDLTFSAGRGGTFLLSDFESLIGVSKASQVNTISNVGSGMCLQPAPPAGDADGFNYAGLPIVQAPCNGSLEQDWSIEYTGTREISVFNLDTYMIVNARSGQCLSISIAGSAEDGTDILQSSCSNASLTRWVIFSREDGTRHISNVNGIHSSNSTCADIRGGSHQSGARVQNYRCTDFAPVNNLAQRFNLTMP